MRDYKTGLKVTRRLTDISEHSIQRDRKGGGIFSIMKAVFAV
jgi:hypothetical protein